jgi:hypothetical protein
MFRHIAGLILVFATACVSAQVDYVKKSDLWMYELGKSAGQGGAAVGEFKGYMRARDEQYQKLAGLKQQVAACGSCADRDKLTKQANELEAKLTQDDRRLCRGFEVQSSSNPAVGAMSKLLGVAPICEKMQAQNAIDSADGRHQANKAQFERNSKAGNVSAYGIMGQDVMNTFRHLPMSERLAMACPYWQEGAAKGDRSSVSNAGQLCKSNSEKVSPVQATIESAQTSAAAAPPNTPSQEQIAELQAKNREAYAVKRCEEATQSAERVKQAVENSPAHQAKYNAFRVSRSEQNRDKACAKVQAQ